QRLSAITQLVENADHTLTAVGYAGGDNGTVTSCLGVNMKLSEDGDVLSAYSHIIKTANPAFYNDVYPHLYETVGNKLLISTEEHDTTAGYSQPILIDPAAMSDYCMANPFTPIIKNLTDYIVESTNSPFSEITMPAITHPTIYTQNITATLNLKDLCGVPLNTYLDEVSADSDMKLIPNPTQANSNVSVSWDGTELVYATVQLYDVSGRLVKQVNVTKGNQSILNLSQLQPGMYVCRLVNSNGELVAVRKLMVTG
ncbi:MAG TPA: T9SS type A sorting domain-containing protein, partial [Chitinophagales bacterium]|nr:T9SS type A sorting domain-containing protein [Chitinophagales bacterium]